ncbi:Vascular endothelial growth factor receptor kdr-like [Portunus trituberculatus]|uniref:Platelet-derived growth factor receptor-like protein n=1 Tax=Portunus trituberculatus TaxID=210409 RepID=A0A5B7FSV8_PORTR|nr:Vascular endothelial growth factor receptor kdr-like [Portunus trituberculatus]
MKALLCVCVCVCCLISASSLQLPAEYAEIVSEEQDEAAYPHVSTLTVTETERGDTGFYRCHYDAYNSLKGDFDNVASTYLYVYDGEHDFVESRALSHKPVSTNQKLVLDCRTTLPTTTLQLMKGAVPMDLSDTHRVRWDPKIGFTLLSLTVHDTAIYECRSESTDEKQQYYVLVSPTSSLDDPIIDEFPDPHYTIGHPFSLNCTVAKGQLQPMLSWSYPNTAAVSATLGPEYNAEVFGTTLILTLDLSSTDKLEPYVRIASMDKIRVEEGNETQIKWRAEVSSYPPDPIIVYRDWHGNVLTESERIKIYSTPNSAYHWFVIQNFTASDFGQYTVTATTTNKAASSNASVVFEIRSAPKVELQNVERYVWPQTRLQVVCHVQGFPLPSIQWEFQPCVDGLSCSPYEAIKVHEGSLSYPQPGNVVKSLSSLTAKSSGFLRCVANNTLGSHNTTGPVTVSGMALGVLWCFWGVFGVLCGCYGVVVVFPGVFWVLWGCCGVSWGVFRVIWVFLRCFGNMQGCFEVFWCVVSCLEVILVCFELFWDYFGVLYYLSALFSLFLGA